MRVLLTGASGFIGRNVLLASPRDWAITAICHKTPLDQFVREHHLDHVIPAVCDLSNSADVDALVSGNATFDVVLYFAANGDPAISAVQPVWDLSSNAVAPLTLLERIRAGRFVFMSSGAVYDGLSGDVTPETPVSPRLPYAISKLATEHYVRFFAERRKSIDTFVNVRFFGAYGPYEAPRKITTRWLRAILNGQREFKIRGNGQNLIDFMYVDDAVDALLRIVRARDFTGTLDLAVGAPLTIDAAVQAMAAAVGAEVQLVHDGHAEEYNEFRSVDSTLRERFGFVPSIPFDAGIRRLRDFLVSSHQERHGQIA